METGTIILIVAICIGWIIGMMFLLRWSEKTKVAYPTVRQAIDKLMRLKKIERIGQGRSTSYRKL